VNSFVCLRSAEKERTSKVQLPDTAAVSKGALSSRETRLDVECLPPKTCSCCCVYPIWGVAPSIGWEHCHGGGRSEGVRCCRCLYVSATSGTVPAAVGEDGVVPRHQAVRSRLSAGCCIITSSLATCRHPETVSRLKQGDLSAIPVGVRAKEEMSSSRSPIEDIAEDNRLVHQPFLSSLQGCMSMEKSEALLAFIIIVVVDY